MDEQTHKNKSRAPIMPLNAGTLALSVGGLGFLRPAPGTWGSMPPVVLAVLLIWAGVDWWVYQGILGVVLVMASAACVVFGGYGERRFGRKDAAEIVADETAGQCLSLMFWPVVIHEGGAWVSRGVFGEVRVLWAAAAAFVMFRLADIFKPWPARRLESLPRGWGVLLDDLVAGLYAAIVVQILVRWLG